MLDQANIMFISYPPILIGAMGLIFCLVRDLINIKNKVTRESNTAPEIYWFMLVLIVVGLFLGFDWRYASAATIILIFSLHPLRKRTKFIRGPRGE